MNKKNYLFLLLFFFKFNLLSAQIAVLPANTISIHNDTTITLMPGGGIDRFYHICPYTDVIFTGISTHMLHLYLESYATAALDDTFSFYVVADLYMKENSSFDFNHKTGSNIDTVLADYPCSLIDTGTSVNNLIPAPNLVFDYSLLPNGINPCPVANQLNEQVSGGSIIIQNPIEDELVIKSENLTAHTTLFLYDAAGKLLGNYQINNKYQKIADLNLKSGFYYYVIYQDGKSYQKGKLLRL